MEQSLLKSNGPQSPVTQKIIELEKALISEAMKKARVEREVEV